MTESQNFKELLLALNDCRVEYLIAGGYAVMRYSEPRFTKDLDIRAGSSQANARRLFAALARFGAPFETTESPKKPSQPGTPFTRLELRRFAWTS